MRPDHVIAFAFLMLAMPAAHALDPASSQAYCDQVKSSAQQAQHRYLETFKPMRNPISTFDSATQACLQQIARFSMPKVPYLEAVQPILQEMAVEFLQKQCRDMTNQYDQQLQEARNYLDGQMPPTTSYNWAGAQSMAVPRQAPASQPDDGVLPAWVGRIFPSLGGNKP